MRVAFFHAVREAFQRRMSLILLVVAFIAAVYYVILFRFEPGPDGQVLVHTAIGVIPVQEFLQFNLPGQLNNVGLFWVVLGALAAVPLLTSYLEPGWVELLVSKGVARWEVLLGRYLAAFAQFTVALVMVCGVTAIHVWLGTGISTIPYLKGVALVLFGYACTLAFATLLAVLQPNVGLVSVLTFAQLFLSPLLTDRQDQFKEVPALQGVVGVFYHVLPKNDELRRMSIDLFYGNPVDTWMPLYSSAVFLVVALSLACWIFQRKSL